jgi:kinesin family protein 6/9
MSLKAKAESSAIQTFLRIRPSKSPSGYFGVDDLDKNAVLFKVPDKLKADYVNNSKLEYRFMFNGILDASATQDRVFDEVGVSAVNNVLDGYNSTIFAYGQTGSGKTYTLTGGDNSYKHRGIIPRAISMLYKEFRSKPTMQYKVYVSYLEIYNEQGYDLLDSSKETKRLEDLQKVRLLEDDQGNFHLKGLAMHPAESEEDALNLLFMGDTNRAIASTSMNDESSRSHCIFSLSVESREAGTDKIRRSKLHLVDLAGSERVAKTNSTGSTLTEATYINKSLFFLEMVIVALYEKATRGRAHVPYRNSLMTSVLRDSLGGNCKTIMVATINPEATETDESLSTCKFAQRVARIENNAVINEEQDPAQMIRRLKNEVLNLREEVSYLKGESGEGEILTSLEQEELVNKVRIYCEDASDETAVLNLGTLTLTKIKAAFVAFRALYRHRSPNGITSSERASAVNVDTNSSNVNADLERQVRDLRELLLQRDSEINILVNMVKKGKTADDVVDSVQRSQTGQLTTSSQSGTNGRSVISARTNSEINTGNFSDAKTSTSSSFQQQQIQQQVQRQQQQQQRIIQRHLFNVPPPSDLAIFEDAAASFEWFRERCALNKTLAENKEELKQKMDEAKLFGERAAQTKYFVFLFLFTNFNLE